MVLKAQLYQRYGLPFDESFAVETENGRRLAHKDGLTDGLHVLGGLYDGVVGALLGRGELGVVKFLLWQEWLVCLLLHKWRLSHVGSGYKLG